MITPPLSPAKSETTEVDQELKNIQAVKKSKFSKSNADVSPVMPRNVSNGDDGTYQTITGMVKQV